MSIFNIFFKNFILTFIAYYRTIKVRQGFLFVFFCAQLCCAREILDTHLHTLYNTLRGNF